MSLKRPCFGKPKLGRPTLNHNQLDICSYQTAVGHHRNLKLKRTKGTIVQIWYMYFDNNHAFRTRSMRYSLIYIRLNIRITLNICIIYLHVVQ